MNIPQYASAAAKLLRRSLPTEQTAGLGEREHGIATIERAMWARARRRRLQWLSAGVAVAASLALAVGLSHGLSRVVDVEAQVSIQGSPAGRGAALRTGERAQSLAERAELAAGQRIETPQAGGASLKLSTGTSMDLADSTSFRVDSQGTTEHFTLDRGQLSAHVAKLGMHQRFIIATPDAEVEVRGTRFRVRVLDDSQACASGTRTRLDVSEGVVEVRAAGTTTRVTAGEHWPNECDQPGPLPPPVEADISKRLTIMPRPQPPESHLSRAPSAAHGGREGSNDPALPLNSPTPGAAAPGSALTAANDAFAAAVALRRAGDSEGALRAYQNFIARFPASPLAENALVERMRILASKRDPHARHEAELYLSRYPNGFAASEAKASTGTP